MFIFLLSNFCTETWKLWLEFLSCCLLNSFSCHIMTFPRVMTHESSLMTFSEYDIRSSPENSWAAVNSYWSHLSSREHLWVPRRLSEFTSEIMWGIFVRDCTSVSRVKRTFPSIFANAMPVRRIFSKLYVQERASSLKFPPTIWRTVPKSCSISSLENRLVNAKANSQTLKEANSINSRFCYK